ncbi:MAG: hypothetical protein MJ076_02480 [Clostridia bacterium]|nr:hypothetical protein [Clostridia bacterium]
MKKKIPGRGFGISEMIMGILGVVYSPILLISLISNMNLNNDLINDFKKSVIGMCVEIAIFGILAVVFGFVSRLKGYKKGKSVAALIMGFITLAICVTTIIIGILLL